MTSNADAIASLLPGVEFSIESDDLSTLVFKNLKQVAPTQQEVDDEIARLDATVSDERDRADAYESDPMRQEFGGKMLQDPAALETYIRNKINADAVTDLESAKAFAKRVEHAFVAFAKAVVRRTM